MAYAIALTDAQWELVADLFDPPGRRGAPALVPRRQIARARDLAGHAAWIVPREDTGECVAASSRAVSGA